MPNIADKEYRQLNEWLDVLHDEVVQLRISHHIWSEVQRIISANAVLKETPSSFYGWMVTNYGVSMAVAIRRLIDDDKRSISFVRLLKMIKDKPVILSRERYRRRYGRLPPNLATMPDKAFDKLVGAGRLHVDPNSVEEEIERLRAKTVKLQKYVNKRIAHYDQKRFPGKMIPRTNDFDEVLDYLEFLLNRYFQIVKATQIANVLPHWQYDWKKIFRYPWIAN